jgi:hypothetical protein
LKLNSEAAAEHGKQLKIELGTTGLLIYVQKHMWKLVYLKLLKF